MAQTQEFRGVARAITTDSVGTTHYVYHRTSVVQRRADGTIVLQSGGWRTPTTKLAMNQASNQDELGFRVSQRDGEWFVLWREIEQPFYDGMVLQ